MTVVAGGQGSGWHTESTNTGFSKTLGSFNPRGSFAYRVGEGVAVRASAYRGFRAPTLNELYRGFRVGSTQTNPNEALLPERLTGGDGGVQISRGAASARLTAFWNILDDAITNVTLSTTPILITKQRANADKIRAAGFEFEGDVRLPHAVTVTLATGITSSVFKGDTSLRDNDVPQIPTYNVGIGARYADHGWSGVYAASRHRGAVRGRSEYLRAAAGDGARRLRRPQFESAGPGIRRGGEPVRQRVRRRAYPDPHHRIAARGSRRRADRSPIARVMPPCSRTPKVGLRATTRMRRVGAHALLCALVALLAAPVEGRGQEPIIDGPPAPLAPEVVSRNAEGRATIRAVRVASPIRIDGALDESLYTTVPSISGFVQVEPNIGEPATEQTEVWIAFDDDNVYVSFKNWDSAPERRIATEMRRDVGNFINGNDIVQIFLDSFYDRRNGLSFSINSIGARNDGQQVGPQVQRRLESDLGSRRRHVRRRMDGRDGAAVQVVPLSAGP